MADLNNELDLNAPVAPTLTLATEHYYYFGG